MSYESKKANNSGEGKKITVSPGSSTFAMRLLIFAISRDVSSSTSSSFVDTSGTLSAYFGSTSILSSHASCKSSSWYNEKWKS